MWAFILLLSLLIGLVPSKAKRCFLFISLFHLGEPFGGWCILNLYPGLFVLTSLFFFFFHMYKLLIKKNV